MSEVQTVVGGETLQFVKLGFGVLDNRGREIGYSVAIRREYSQWRKNGIWVYPHALRDGKEFGALPVRAYKHFSSIAGALAYRDELIERARARAQKVAA